MSPAAPLARVVPETARRQPSACWVALHLPALRLEAFMAALPADDRGLPLALLDGGRIGTVNAAAASLGVQSGQTRATALALAPSLRLGLADAARDAQAREAVAHTALQFTPAVSWDGPATLLLEVAATLRLWGGLDQLLGRLREALAPLRHRVVTASAPTPLGAALLAQAASAAVLPVPESSLGVSRGVSRVVTRGVSWGPAAVQGTAATPGPEAISGPDAASGSEAVWGGAGGAPAWVALAPILDLATLRRRLDRLPLAVPARWLATVAATSATSATSRTLSWARAADGGRADEALDALCAMGLRTLGDLRALPRDGVARRFGPGWLALLDRARGDAADPREPLRACETFETRIELFHRADLGAQVAEGARPLLARLVAWAQARQGRVEHFTLAMRHESRHRHDDRTPEATRLAISLAEPSNELAHLALLLRERLARLSLPAPTLELVLTEARLVHAPPPQDQLFPTPACARTNLTRLFERLQARLGAEGILQLEPVPDHRPERATRLVATVQGRLPRAWMAAWMGAETGSRLGFKAQGVLPAEAGDVAGAVAGTVAGTVAVAMTGAVAGAVAGTAADGPASPKLHADPPALTRPAWLLPHPQPLPHPPGLQTVERPWLDGRPLRLLSGPERIESGWWDGEAVARDYFIAGDEEGALLWVYRQRLQATAAAEGISQGSPGTAQPPAHWYLHGWFG